MSITSQSSGTSSTLKSRTRKHGPSGSTCVHSLQANVEHTLPDEGPVPTAKISFASDTNFKPRLKSRISKRSQTATINIRPVKVGESTHVAKFQVPKATVPSFVHKYYSVTKADFLETADTSKYPDYSKIPRYICRSNSNHSEDNILSEDKHKKSTASHPGPGHRSLFHGRCNDLNDSYGPSSDRTHVRQDSNFGKETDDLRMLKKQNRFANPSEYVPVKPLIWAPSYSDISNFHTFLNKKPVFTQNRDTRLHFGRGRSFHFDSEEYAKRLYHKVKCPDIKLRTNNQHLSWNLNQDSLCDFYNSSQVVRNNPSTESKSDRRLNFSTHF